MLWVPVTALLILVAGLLIVVRDAASHAPKQAPNKSDRPSAL